MTETGESRGEHGGPWWWGRRRSAVLDVALGAVSAAECGGQGASFADEVGVLPVWSAVLLGVVAGSTLALRRRWPAAVVLVGVAVTPAEMGMLLALVGLYTLAASDVPRRTIGLLAAMQMAGALIVTVVQMHRSIGRDPDFDPSAWFLPSVSLATALALTAPPLLLGLYVGARRRLVVSLRERADGLERELALLADRAEERAEWARNEERTRIAREMHDVVAHRVSLMVVHAAALESVALRDPEKASRNAALVGDMGRRALTELRTMLGVLRSQGEQSGQGGPEGRGERGAGAGAGALERDSGTGPGSAGGPVPGSGAGPADGAGEPGTPGGSAADEAGERAGGGAGRALPDGCAVREAAGGDLGPRLGELAALVGQSRAAGMVVEFSVETEEPEDPEESAKPGESGESGEGAEAAGGTVRAYGPHVERTAFRVVQEALTNVHKHAAGARTRVRLAQRTAEVAVQVENGPPAAAAGHGTGDGDGDGDGAGAVVPDAGLPSGGNGLAGMRERVTALGGGFVSGPTESGGFRVSAVIPAGPAAGTTADPAERNAQSATGSSGGSARAVPEGRR